MTAIHTALLTQVLTHKAAGHAGMQAFSGNAVRCSRDRSNCCGCGYSAPANEANEVTDCPKLYPVVGYLAHCKDMCKELGVPENSDVSLVYVRAQGLECCIVLLHSKSVAGESR